MSYTIVVYYTYDRVAFIKRTEERDDETCRNFRTRIKLAEYNTFLESLDGASAL